MKIEDILLLESRRNIYNYISRYPGLHLRELSRKLQIPKTTLDYHLMYLKRRDLIREESTDNKSRYFVNNSIDTKDKQLFSLMRKEIPRKIILILCSCGTQSQKDIIYFDRKWPKLMKKINFKMDKHQTTISFHLKKLEKMEIVESWQEGTQTLYKLKNPMLCINFLIKYEGKLFDSAARNFVKLMDFYAIEEELIDKLEKTIFDIFPHPYRG